MKKKDRFAEEVQRMFADECEGGTDCRLNQCNCNRNPVESTATEDSAATLGDEARLRANILGDKRRMVEILDVPQRDEVLLGINQA